MALNPSPQVPNLSRLANGNLASVVPDPTGSLVQAMNISLSTPGRLGFYIDYSELSASGTHTFYVCRTHGTAGSVSVSYATYGDAHTQVTGTVSWGDGDASIQSIDVPVTKSNNGEHRIYIELSSPTGGAVLHFGAETKAYGVIDDGSVPNDEDAVFYDADAVTNGTGTAASPYNNIKEAIAAVSVTTKRYLCGRGVTVVDTTFDSIAVYSTPSYAIQAPSTRTGESDRLIIRNWPGFSWRVTGDGNGDGISDRTDVMAFIDKSGAQYHTYKGIQIDTLDSNTGSPSAGIWYHYGSHLGCTFEHLTIYEIDGAENQAGISFYGGDGSPENYDQSAKIWRCSINSIRRFGTAVGSAGGSGVLSYDGANISIQGCTFSIMNAGVYQKRMSSNEAVSPSVRFCLFDGVELEHGQSGNANSSASYSIIQANVFKGLNGAEGTDGIQYKTDSLTNIGNGPHWLMNNTFYQVGPTPSVNFKNIDGLVSANNIFHDCRWAFFNSSDNSENGAIIDVWNYNHLHNIGFKPYHWRAADYDTSAALNTASGALNLAANESEAGADTLFTDEMNGDFTLQSGSPCKAAGWGGVDQGAYWTGIEVIGV